MPTPNSRAWPFWTACLVLAMCGTAMSDEKSSKPVPQNPFPDRPLAPELDGGIEWLNTSGPISLKELRGKIVLLDFWTFCCINCMHVIPDLKYLEEKYPNELVVIGVHTAKFENERDTDNIRNAILRYEIAHPVINDARMTLWNKYHVNSWPTLALIDPEGKLCGLASGEGNRQLLDQIIGRLIAYHRAKGTLDEKPLHFDLERSRQTDTPLRFPGKILADAESNRLFISDSNHNRIVITSLDGKLLDVIGSGAIGKADGTYKEVEFDHPQGMTLVDEILYVADTENHLIRAIDLKSKSVSTLAGTGEQGQIRSGAFPLREAGLNSPWDIAQLNGVLYICMAGPHQIWSHQIGSNTIQPYAGSGREDIKNGKFEEAALAQPSGITTDGTFLYVCDSEGSAIRRLTVFKGDLHKPHGEVITIAGTSDLPNGRSLFEFGDVSGKGSKARFQHPLGIAYHNGMLYVADSYNHKIKTINVKNHDAENWLGTGKPGNALKAPQFDEPAGLSIANDKLYIADTNNHRICVANLKSKAMTVLTIAGLQPPVSTAPAESVAVGEEETLPVQKVAAAKAVEFELVVQLPPGFKLNPEAPVTYIVKADDAQLLIPNEALNAREEASVENGTVKFEVPLAAKRGAATLHVAVSYQYCRDGDNGVCKLGSARYAIPVEIAADAAGSTIRLQTKAK